MSKPRIFIGSSVESLPVAEAIHLNLEHDMEITLWRAGTFSLSNQTVDDLIAKACWVDFGLFVFTPDDIALIRNSKHSVTRDNVVFELGLFIGALGRKRCFILKPRETELSLPSDLAGLTAADYDPNRSDDDLESALVSASIKIKKEVEKSGLRDKESTILKEKLKTISGSFELAPRDFAVLRCLLPTETTGQGYTSWNIADAVSKVGNWNDIDFSIVKLLKLGLIKKIIHQADVGDDYVEFFISENGIEHLLSNTDDAPPF